jgi:hypothetical protein
MKHEKSVSRDWNETGSWIQLVQHVLTNSILGIEHMMNLVVRSPLPTNRWIHVEVGSGPIVRVTLVFNDER